MLKLLLFVAKIKLPHMGLPSTPTLSQLANLIIKEFDSKPGLIHFPWEHGQRKDFPSCPINRLRI